LTVQWPIRSLVFSKQKIAKENCVMVILGSGRSNRPWWWCSGQRSRLLLRRSELESLWLLNFTVIVLTVKKDGNKRKRGRYWPI